MQIATFLTKRRPRAEGFSIHWGGVEWKICPYCISPYIHTFLVLIKGAHASAEENLFFRTWQLFLSFQSLSSLYWDAISNIPLILTDLHRPHRKDFWLILLRPPCNQVIYSVHLLPSRERQITKGQRGEILKSTSALPFRTGTQTEPQGIRAHVLDPLWTWITFSVLKFLQLFIPGEASNHLPPRKHERALSFLFLILTGIHTAELESRFEQLKPKNSSVLVRDFGSRCRFYFPRWGQYFSFHAVDFLMQ